MSTATSFNLDVGWHTTGGVCITCPIFIAFVLASLDLLPSVHARLLGAANGRVKGPLRPW